jgi:hypothetical protein
MTTKKLQDLGELAAELLEKARKLPPGPDRQDALKKGWGVRNPNCFYPALARFTQSRDQIAGT